MNDQDEYPFARPQRATVLASRGLCDPQTAVEYVARKLLSQETFQEVRASGLVPLCSCPPTQLNRSAILVQHHFILVKPSRLRRAFRLPRAFG
jgi:hypothetical protein